MCVIWSQSIHVLFFISKCCKCIVLFISDFCRVNRSEISSKASNLSVNGLVLTLSMGQHENALFDPRVLWRTIKRWTTNGSCILPKFDWTETS